MGSRLRASRRITLAAVAAAHVGLFALLSLGLAPRSPPAGREVVMTPVYLARAEPERRKPRDTRRATPTPLRVLAAPAPAQLPATVAPAVVAAPAPPSAADDAERAQLARVLRASRAGCATPHLLTADERAKCERRLADGAQLATYIPTPLPPERRAFYDAVAKAKQPFHAEPMRPGEHPVPPPSAGGGSLAALQAANAVSIPLVGCKFSFGGPGAGVVKPPHGLRLGSLPCFINPPQGPFTVEANIRNPDTK